MILDLDAHREEIKDALVSLGTYTHALVAEGGGKYRLDSTPYSNVLKDVVDASRDALSAESRVRLQIGPDLAIPVPALTVIRPLADAIVRARSGDARGTIVAAGNAIESYLVFDAARVGVNLTGATGVNAKLDKYTAARMPKKIAAIGKAIGNIRNAADHGIDPDVNAAWDIDEQTGVVFPFLCTSFIAAVENHRKGTSRI